MPWVRIGPPIQVGKHKPAARVGDEEDESDDDDRKKKEEEGVVSDVDW